MKRLFAFLFLLLLQAFPLEARIEPSGTYLYAQKDGEDLYLDIYEPMDSAAAFVQIDSVTIVVKPTILFAFGGGFVGGSRDHESYLGWFEALCKEGFRVVSIDYRLGLKGVGKMGVAQRDKLDRAIHMVVEDIFSSVLFLRENSAELGIDTDKIVLAGSSAGAISVLQADYELCNRTSYAENMPEGFRFAGVMSFAGAIYSTKGPVKYEKQAPAPTLFLHGTVDKLVNYDQIRFMNLGFFGTNRLVERFEKFGYSYNVFRFRDHGHEIAGAMPWSLPLQLQFLATNVIRGIPSIIDVTVSDPRIEAPEKWKQGPEAFYK